MRRIGPDLVFGRLWDQCSIQRVPREQLQHRDYEFDVERAIFQTVLNRLFASGSDRAGEQWREEYRIAGTEKLQLHHLYRAMARLGEPFKEEKTLLGSPRSGGFGRARNVVPKTSRTHATH